MRNAWFFGVLLLGFAGWMLLFRPWTPAVITLGSAGPWWLLVLLLICLAAAWFPPLAAPIYRSLQRLSTPSPHSRVIASIAVAAASSLYLCITAVNGHRQFFPYIHDEFSYLIQAHQFARDKLWMPGHPLAPFFDSFQLFAQPVYASAYFPGTALLYLPGVWLHVPPYVTSLLSSGAVAGLFFWITTEVLDGLAGWLAVLLLWSDGQYRQVSLLTLGQMPLLLYALLATVAWLRWRATIRTDWAIGMGFFLGLAAVTRPVDALCFAVPIAIDVLLRCVKKRSLSTLAGIWIGLLPMLALQLLLNHGITGQWEQTPFNFYADRDYPGTRYGFHPYDPSARPASDLPQKQKLYDQDRPLIAQHRRDNILSQLLHPRLPWVLSQASFAPFQVLILLLPLSLPGLGILLKFQRPAIGVLLLTLPLFLLLYSPYVFFFPHYVLVTAPALILGILLGAKALWSAWPRYTRFAMVATTLFIAGNATAALPNGSNWNEDVFTADLLANVNRQLATLPHRPAVVLFTFDPNRNVNEEPVYNADFAWPDDAEVIRAHDLGPQNQAIFSYYAQRQPERFFYRFDEARRSLQPLGTARELASRF
jgi:hypothetical protein